MYPVPLIWSSYRALIDQIEIYSRTTTEICLRHAGLKRTSNYLGISIIQRTSCLKQQVRESLHSRAKGVNARDGLKKRTVDLGITQTYSDEVCNRIIRETTLQSSNFKSHKHLTWGDCALLEYRGCCNGANCKSYYRSQSASPDLINVNERSFLAVDRNVCIYIITIEQYFFIKAFLYRYAVIFYTSRDFNLVK